MAQDPSPRTGTGSDRPSKTGRTPKPPNRAPRPSPPGPRPANEPRPGYTAVGRVTRPHGIRGEVRVSTFEPGTPNLGPGRTVHLQGAPLRVQRARPDRGDWIVLLEGVSDRNSAEALRGELLEVPDDQVRRHDSDSYFIHELIGLRVLTREGEDVGAIREVLQTGANDVYVVDGAYGEVLVPAIGEVIERVDISKREVLITPLAGMLDKPK